MTAHFQQTVAFCLPELLANGMIHQAQPSDKLPGGSFFHKAVGLGRDKARRSSVLQGRLLFRPGCLRSKGNDSPARRGYLKVTWVACLGFHRAFLFGRENGVGAVVRSRWQRLLHRNRRRWLRNGGDRSGLFGLRSCGASRNSSWIWFRARDKGRCRRA